MWRQRYARLKKLEAELRAALAGADPDALDAAIESYDKLQMNLNPTLLQTAISKRDALSREKAARSALESAVEAMDVERLKAALEAAAEAGMQAAEKLLATELLDKLSKYYGLQSSCGRDLEKARQCVAMAAELGLHGPKEERTAALLATLEEEEDRSKQATEEEKTTGAPVVGAELSLGALLRQRGRERRDIRTQRRTASSAAQ